MTASLLPWLTVAGLGALHGLNPAGGWLFAAAWGVHSGDRAQALWALVPIAIGHTASVALVGGAVVLGFALDRAVLQVLAGGLVAVLAIHHLWRRGAKRVAAPAGHAGLALWSFMMSSAHGAGLLLVPALIPFCMDDAQARQIAAPGSLALALAAIGVHTAAMLVVTGLVASGAYRGFAACAGRLRKLGLRA